MANGKHKTKRSNDTTHVNSQTGRRGARPVGKSGRVRGDEEAERTKTKRKWKSYREQQWRLHQRRILQRPQGSSILPLIRHRAYLTSRRVRSEDGELPGQLRHTQYVLLSARHQATFIWIFFSLFSLCLWPFPISSDFLHSAQELFCTFLYIQVILSSSCSVLRPLSIAPTSLGHGRLASVCTLAFSGSAWLVFPGLQRAPTTPTQSRPLHHPSS